MHKTSAALLVAAFLAAAGPAHSATPADPVPIEATVPPAKASLAHSGIKTLTYEFGNTINNFLFLSVASGGPIGGALLTAFNTMQSWTVYTVNDYIWERLYPKQTTENAAYDLQQSFWHTTVKYMTGKPVVASIKIAALSLYTGSLTTGLAYGLAATAGASVVFFANNLAWDFYDRTMGRPVMVASVTAASLPDGSGP